MDVRNYRLIWPKDRTPEDVISKPSNTMVPKIILKCPTPNPKVQKNMECRDCLFEKDIAKDTSKVKPQARFKPPRTYAMDSWDRFSKMDRELEKPVIQEPYPASINKKKKLFLCYINKALLVLFLCTIMLGRRTQSI